MNVDDGFDEFDLYEAEYADQLELLDELEGVKSTNNQPATATTSSNQEEFDYPEISQRESRRRKLFETADDETQISFVGDIETEELVIDEDFNFGISPQKKRAKVENLFRPNLPTTLDSDKDVIQQRLDDQRYKNNLSTPQILKKIQTYRKNRNTGHDFIENEKLAANNECRTAIKLTKVLVRPPMHSEFVSATSSDGQRVYMRLRNDDRICKVSSINELLKRSRSTRLLPQSMTELRQEIFDTKQFDIIEESRRITDEIRRDHLQLSGQIIVNDNLDKTIDEEEKEKDEGICSEDDNSRDCLWVNKYAPTRYTHLLSDETVNRSLLKWLKLWDSVVFGRDPPTRKSNEKKDRQSSRKFPNNKIKNFQSGFSPEDELDDTKRPKFKAALLCGPPGLGKTTLAHVIAKHAGYHVVEMNASDDRSAEVFQKKLDETTQMRSVLGVDHLPNCLIVDEIDGAPQATINILLNVMNRGKKNDVKKRKQKSGANGLLLRPIICICNDLYVPALRQLRQNSFVLHFPPTTSTKLASRLKQVCHVQKFKCDTTSLLALCDKSSNDIRTCINTLQFLKSKGEMKLDVKTIRNLPIGQKDQQQSVFYVWNEIFQLPKDKRKMDRDSQVLQQTAHNEQKMSQFSIRFYHILNVIQTNGEYEKALQGVFDNFLLMKFKDCAMQAVNKAYEWLALYDYINGEVFSRQEWILMQYFPYLFVIFHFLFSCISPPRIPFSQTVQENRQKRQKNENLISSMFVDMSPSIRCFASQAITLLEIVPYLLLIMTPNLRPVNMQLYSVTERKQLNDLVSSMLSYNLTYRQERNEEGQYNYVLEPNMADVCHFTDVDPIARRQLSYAIKQVIAKEVEVERMRRMEQLITSNATEAAPQSCKLKDKDAKSSKKDFVPNHLQRLENNLNTVQIPLDKPAINFFSRFSKIKSIDGNEKTSKKTVQVRDPGIGNSDLWFKYNEGFSNAVRRKVYVKDFL